MRKAKSGDRVHIRFVGRLDDGTVFDSSSRRGRLEITLGEGEVIPGVDKAIHGLAVGERLATRVPPEEAFGPHRDELVVAVPKSRFPTDDPTPGERCELKTDSGSPLVQVLEVREESVRVDANHPLAGQPLNLELELLEIA